VPNRILYEKVCVSETLAMLSGDEERFFYRLLVQCDDYGRFDARPLVLRARCFALQLDSVTDADVTAWLAALERVGLVLLYAHEGRPYLEISTWATYQQTRAKRSKYPDPRDDASICKQMQADADIGARIRYPESLSENRYPESDSPRADDAVSNGANAPATPRAEEPSSKRSRKQPTTPPPESLEPNDADYAAGAEVGLSREQVALKTTAMLDFFRAKGEARSDWHATLRVWLRNAPKFDQPPRASPPSRASPAAQPVAAVAPTLPARNVRTY
jgi:hypothetical protein